MSHAKHPIRVLIAEDSPVMRELLVSLVQGAPGFQVVGTARTGAEAVRLAKRLQPDIIAMDIHMPEMDGFEATRRIMTETPRPIVLMSASFSKYERTLAFDALQAGALSALEKPTMRDSVEAYRNLIGQLRLMSEVKVVRRWGGPSVVQMEQVTPPPIMTNHHRASKLQLVAIGASTGGPAALASLLSELPADFPVPILIVQHISPGFSLGFASWLNQKSPLEVRLARHNDEPQPGQVLIAPDSQHMVINSMGLVALHNGPAIHNLRPAANLLFESVAQVYGSTAIGVILTGMGSDGAEGLSSMRRAGARTIAQNKESCVVFGMPAVAINLGAAEQVLHINQIAAALVDLLKK